MRPKSILLAFLGDRFCTEKDASDVWVAHLNFTLQTANSCSYLSGRNITVEVEFDGQQHLMRAQIQCVQMLDMLYCWVGLDQRAQLGQRIPIKSLTDEQSLAFVNDYHRDNAQQ